MKRSIFYISAERIIALLFSILCCSNQAWAHAAVQTDTAIEIVQSVVRVVYTTSNENISQLTNNLSHAPEVILGGLTLSSDNQPCMGEIVKTKQLESLKARQFWFDFQCSRPLKVLKVRDDLLFDVNPSYVNFVRISMAGRLNSVSLTQQNKSFSLPVETLLSRWQAQLAPEPMPGAADDSVTIENVNEGYFSLGVKHILTGFDHLLFLVALFSLPIHWRQVLTIITSFTVAHSITLSLATLKIVSLPTGLTEWFIALSIIVTALQNLFYLQPPTSLSTATVGYNRILRRRWLTSFGFGLLHGFGFSTVLQDIGLGSSIAGNLLMFNLGVESGQLAVLLLASPILFLLLRSRLQWISSLGLSMFAVMAGTFWLIQRSTFFV